MQNKNELPEWDGITKLYCNDYDFRGVPEYARECVVYKDYFGKWTIGFVLKKPYVESQFQRYRSRKYIRKLNAVFRYDPVPCTNYNKNYIRARRLGGIIKEIRHNDMCKQEFPELELVRKKRKNDAPDHFKGWALYERHYNDYRGWKRTKKRKQWM